MEVRLLKTISILLSSINTIRKFESSCGLSKFQFYLVLLILYFDENGKECALISILLSSINTMPFDPGTATLITFQFYLVLLILS